MPALADRAVSRWSDLGIRVASAGVLVPLALGALWLGGAAWTALVLVMLAGVGWEVAHLARPAGTRGLVIGMGVVWVGLAGPALLWLRSDADVGFANTAFVLVLVWASDIGAYLAGRAVGGPRLAPSISPGKTWSGAVGGLAAAAILGILLAKWLSPAGIQVGAARAGFLAVLLGMVAQAGDLAESWLKRRVGVKDSSGLIPGHGGLLDRLDALLAASPVAAVWAWYLGRGVVLWC